LADPQAYARAAISGRYRICEKEAVAMLRDMLSRELEYAERERDHARDGVLVPVSGEADPAERPVTGDPGTLPPLRSRLVFRA
jgi:hypothetical protein